MSKNSKSKYEVKYLYSEAQRLKDAICPCYLTPGAEGEITSLVSSDEIVFQKFSKSVALAASMLDACSDFTSIKLRPPPQIRIKSTDDTNCTFQYVIVYGKNLIYIRLEHDEFHEYLEIEIPPRIFNL